MPETVTENINRTRISSLTVQLGTVITLFAFVGYVGNGMVSFISFIPLIFGVPLIVFGRLSRNEKNHRRWIRFAVFFGLLCALTTWAGFMDLMEATQLNLLPSLSQILRTVMFFGCSAYTGFGFIHLWRIRNRRNKKTVLPVNL